MKISKFRKILFISWAALCGLVLVILTVFGFYLADFEENRPEKYCEELLAAYKTADCETIYPCFTSIPKAFLSEELFKEYIEKYLPATELYYYEQSASTDEVKQYDFMVGDKKFGSLTVSPKTEKSFFDHITYEVTAFEEFALFEYAVTFADGISVSADGNPVDLKFLSDRTLLTDNFVKIGRSEYYVNKFIIDELTYIKEFSAVTPLDTSKTVISELESEFYFTVSDQESEEIKSFCREFYKKYAVYVTLAYQKVDKVLPYIHADSDFGEKLALVDNRYGEYPKSYTFENEQFSNLYRYSEDDFSIDVKVELILTKRKETRVCPLNIKIFISNTDEGFKVVDMEMLSE